MFLDLVVVFNPLLSLLSHFLWHVLQPQRVVERIDQANNRPLVRLECFALIAESRKDGRNVVVRAYVGCLDAVHGVQVRTNIGFGDGLWDAERGLVGVVWLPGGRVVPYQAEDDVGEVDTLAEDLDDFLSVAPDGLEPTDARAALEYALKVLFFSYDVAVVANKLAHGEQTLVTRIL